MTPTASDKPEPTPGEWQVHEKYPLWIMAGDKPVAYTHCECRTNAEAEANAAHIVKCVNFYDSYREQLSEAKNANEELVKALEAIANEVYDIESARHKAEQALALASGQG